MLARKWTRLEYDRLVEAEFLGPEDRIELLGGNLIVRVASLAAPQASIFIADLLP